MLADSTTFFTLHASARIFFTTESIALKRAAASGSSFFTSSEWMNSDSRYAHVRWISERIWFTSATIINFLFQPMMASSNVFMYRFASMPCTTTWLSSSASKSSSPSLIVFTSVSLCFICIHSTLAQVTSSFARDTSIFASFCAQSTISPTSSSNLCSSSASSESSENWSSMTKDLPVTSMSELQWRSRMSGDRRSATSGTDVRKFLTESSSPMNASVARSFLGRPLTSFWNAFVASSMVAVSMSFHSVSRHFVNCFSTSAE